MRDVHRHSQQRHPHRNPPDGKKRPPHPLARNPPVHVERQPKREQVLEAVHRRERLAGFLAVAVHHVRHHACRRQLHPEVDKPQADDDGDGPGVQRVGGLAPGEEAGCREEEVGDQDGEAEFGFCCS